MNHSLPLKVSALVYALFGLPLLFAPNALMEVYEAPQLNGPGVYNSMLLGATYVAFAVMVWVASQLPYREARPVMLGALLANGLGLLVAIYRQLVSADAVAAGWVNVAVLLVFSALYARLYFQGAEARSAARPAA